jgi:rhodanese-related sulfurtransferase
MKSIRARELKDMMERRDDLQVINVLERDAFEKEHVPGSTNVPLSRDDFARAVEQQVGAQDGTVVVYCSSKECTASPKAARKLTEAGFSDVIHFAGGMAEWKTAGFDVETGAEATASR